MSLGERAGVIRLGNVGVGVESEVLRGRDKG